MAAKFSPKPISISLLLHAFVIVLGIVTFPQWPQRLPLDSMPVPLEISIVSEETRTKAPAPPKPVPAPEPKIVPQPPAAPPPQKAPAIAETIPFTPPAPPLPPPPSDEFQLESKRPAPAPPLDPVPAPPQENKQKFNEVEKIIANLEKKPAKKVQENDLKDIEQMLKKMETKSIKTESTQKQNLQKQEQVNENNSAKDNNNVSDLTISEQDAVKRQLAVCWNLHAGARDAEKLLIELELKLNPEGRVMEARIKNQHKMQDSYYRAAGESALRAVFDPRCNKLRLPKEKYEKWKNLELVFNPKEMF